MDQFQVIDVGIEGSEGSSILPDCAATGLIAVDAQGRISSLNREAERLTGLRATAVLQQPSTILPAALYELVEQTFNTKTETSKELTLAPPEGIPIQVRAATLAYQNQHNQVTGVLILLSNIGMMHRLAATMQRLDRLASIGTLSASMAHEIRNALVPISTFLDELLQRNKESELAPLVRREVKRIEAIVSQMLKFAGPAKPTFARVSVHRILDQSLRLIQPQMESKQIRLRRAFVARPDRIDGDDYQLEQAFLNLFLNAVAAMETNGQLSVSTEIKTPPPAGPMLEDGPPPPGPALQITIADSGAGIAPEHLSRLFEPFYSTKPQGTGLGLAITRRIVLEHHGQIDVESELQKGTTFRISLPLPGAAS